jgi:hypothetical protein
MGSLRILPEIFHTLARYQAISSSIVWTLSISGLHVEIVTILCFRLTTKTSSSVTTTYSSELKSRVITSTDWEKGSQAVSE